MSGLPASADLDRHDQSSSNSRQLFLDENAAVFFESLSGPC